MCKLVLVTVKNHKRQKIQDDKLYLQHYFLLLELVTPSKHGVRSAGNISNLITFQVGSSSQSFNEERLSLFPKNLRTANTTWLFL